MFDHDNALKTDLYELTMAAGYFQNNMDLRATFELFCHKMPKNRAFLVACGLEQALRYIQNLKFTDKDIDYLKHQPAFRSTDKAFFRYLKNFKFTGDVWAMPEGEIFFNKEPVLQVEAPIIEAQILETYLLSIFNIQSLVATKAARIAQAARCDGKERGVVDFGSRRAHGPQAGILAARASYIGGCAGTSNVCAGEQFGIPVYGTIAHSWVEAFDSEMESFAAYHKYFKDNTVLLIDTYDTVKCAEKVASSDMKIKAVRIDSGNLEKLSKKVRAILDNCGKKDVKIIASGNLDERKIAKLVKSKAPIDVFGVGSALVTSKDDPVLDVTYKLVQTTDKDNNIVLRFKKSKGKVINPGRKQVFRKLDKKGRLQKDTIGFFSEKPPAGGRPLLKPVMKRGSLVKLLPQIKKVRDYARKRLEIIPQKVRNDLNAGSYLENRLEYTKQLSDEKKRLMRKF